MPMQLTKQQHKYIAWTLERNRSESDEDKFTSVLTEAQVDLNPHQIDAALFAFRSPLSMGAILADEVGLGKTIEAALVIAQKWAERRRHILIIAPATLRKQWSMELEEKFFLPSLILESKNFNNLLNESYRNPFDTKDYIVICSYQFAKKQIKHIQRVSWDLVVIDEAHKLRNVYKKSNKTAVELREGLKNAKKLLLTATPLQNNIKELFGLVSIIDENYFGGLKSFSDQYGKTELRSDTVFKELRSRIQPIIHRTLRSDVQEYVKYTERKPFVQEYYPSNDEIALQEMVQEYLQRDNCFGMPPSQRTLISLVLHKLLSSSTFAIAGTLLTIIQRLESIVADNQHSPTDVVEEIIDDIDDIESYEEEWANEDDSEDSECDESKKEYTPEDIKAIEDEIHDLKIIHELALGIARNTKGECLLKALDIAFEDKRKHGQPEKALIFTESNRTQLYLKKLLEENGYEGKIVLFNGSNSDPSSRQIYNDWKARYAGTSRITGSTTADKRQAIVDYFRETAHIMIATEAASEGINLQFCSLLVNFDLPWNPQRVEQRIGRCHRYGQQNDVVVVNFINKANRADQRVYELLDEKYNLFKGVFGSSDEVLGKVMDGIDFEHRVLDIYQSCRNVEDIDKAFDQLQDELRDKIEASVADTQARLIENFDLDVVNKLRIRRESAASSLSQFQQLLWLLTIDFLGNNINILDASRYKFLLRHLPVGAPSLDVGPYQMGKNIDDAFLYRIGHPLAQYILASAKETPTPDVENIVFDYSSYPAKISVLSEQLGHTGSLEVKLLRCQSPQDSEEHIIGVAVDADGNTLPDDFVEKLMLVPATISSQSPHAFLSAELSNMLSLKTEKVVSDISARNKEFINEESAKISRWAEDQTFSVEQEIRDTKRQIKERERQFRSETDSAEQLRLQREIQSLQRLQRQKRQELFAVEDEIDRRRDELIRQIEASLERTITESPLFRINWIIK